MTHLIDWADVREQLRMMTLRASIAVNGRSVVLYERTFEFKHYNSPRSHQRFLDELKQVMPPNCTPILITDAGYRNTWFRQVEALGWYWLGRLRGEVGVKLAKQGWLSNKSFFTKANTQPQHLGSAVIAKKSPLACQLYLYKGADKKRKGKRHRRTGQKHSAQHLYQRSAKEPWVLATNLPPAMFTAKQVVKLYAKRMQIEESFRDLKSPDYGFGLRHFRSRSTKRLDILLLISLLAEIVLWCIGLIARQQNWQYQFQANTIKTRHVLSITRLAKEVLRRQDHRISSADIQWAICEYIRVIHQTAMLKL
ncbi:IS4 family transposase [Motilimonas cestriensis]|uniref:IS4 family transposase n=1 Tax=Motilimonas cestriensis TaxID=2742685 RepID=UPI003DA3ED35